MDSQHAPEFGRPDKYSWARLGEALIKRCQERVQEEQKAQQEQRPLAGARYGDDKKRTLRVGMYRRSTAVATSIRDRTLGLPSDLMYSCLIHLRLQYLEGYSRRSLKCLAYLPVRVLELVQYAESEGGPLLNDKMCWSWSQRAKTEGGFAELQVLRITSKWHQISKTGLLSLRSLPKLMIVDINTPGPSTGHGESNLSGHKPGWRRAPLEVSLFQTYAQAYLKKRVAIVWEEERALDASYRSSTTLLPIQSCESLLPASAYNVGPFRDRSLRFSLDHESEEKANNNQDPWDNADNTTFESLMSVPAHPGEIHAWLGLVDYYTPSPEDAEKIQFHAAGVPVPRKRLIHLEHYGVHYDRPRAEWEASSLPRSVYRRFPDEDDGDSQRWNPATPEDSSGSESVVEWCFSES